MEKEIYLGIVEINENVISIIKRENDLIAGGCTNCGMIESYKHEIDDCFSFDENLQEFIEKIEEEMHE